MIPWPLVHIAFVKVRGQPNVLDDNSNSNPAQVRHPLPLPCDLAILLTKGTKYISLTRLCIRLCDLFGQQSKSEVSEPTMEKASHALACSSASLPLSERNIAQLSHWTTYIPKMRTHGAELPQSIDRHIVRSRLALSAVA